MKEDSTTCCEYGYGPQASSGANKNSAQPGWPTTRYIKVLRGSDTARGGWELHRQSAGTGAVHAYAPTIEGILLTGQQDVTLDVVLVTNECRVI